MSGNRIEEGSVTPNPAAASTLSSRRNGDISSTLGLLLRDNNPDKEIYNLAEARFGAKWVSMVRVVSSYNHSNFQHTFGHFAPRNKAAMAI